MSELIDKLEKYAEKHDLTEEEKQELGEKLNKDWMIYGNAYLDMEEGRLKPSEARKRISEGEYVEKY